MQTVYGNRKVKQVFSGDKLVTPKNQKEKHKVKENNLY